MLREIFQTITDYPAMALVFAVFIWIMVGRTGEAFRKGPATIINNAVTGSTTKDEYEA